MDLLLRSKSCTRDKRSTTVYTYMNVGSGSGDDDDDDDGFRV